MENCLEKIYNYKMNFNLLKNIDYNDALERVGDDIELYVELLRDFTENYSNTGNTYIEFLKNKDIDGALRVIHTVKGLTGTLGAKELSTITKELEQAIKSRDTNLVKKIHPTFKRELESIVESMEDFINSLEIDDNSNNEMIDLDLLITTLKELKDAAINKRAASLKKILTILREYSYDDHLKEPISNIEILIKSYKFKEIVGLIDSVLETIQ